MGSLIPSLLTLGNLSLFMRKILETLSLDVKTDFRGLLKAALFLILVSQYLCSTQGFKI